ncbi:hypothetical protein CROQUDRAFT_342308 [Cronartium quercuum f. sp. fusiforme G11]|uniref:Uncharacterized protein n=1 Tax=Cronartium quercuum f. sp. fusiforme G11 TaxID=708437 RepID=A0A9P6NS94_9BASI|nr:hypothetical protein CROQUDRAFT_342308 [Cronartium quercuum f. sp. fusiforme G11]
MSIPEKEASGFQTDVRRRTNLSTTTNALRSMAEGPNEGMSMSSHDFLRSVEDEMNRIVDRDVETLVEGMEEIIDLSVVGAPDKLRSLQDSLAIELRAETLVRSCTSLLSLSHSMKMMWLLGDEAHFRKIRDEKVLELTREIKSLKAEVADLMESLKSDANVVLDPHDCKMEDVINTSV